MDYPPLRALFLITTKGIPGLKNPERWSPEFKDFVSKCLIKEAENRPTADELLKVFSPDTHALLPGPNFDTFLQHPFLRLADTAEADIVPVIKQARRVKYEQMESLGI